MPSSCTLGGIPWRSSFLPAGRKVGPRSIIRLRVDAAGRLLGGAIPERDIVIERFAGVTVAGASPPVPRHRRPGCGRASQPRHPRRAVVRPSIPSSPCQARTCARSLRRRQVAPMTSTCRSRGATRANMTRRYPVLYVLDGQWDFKLMLSVQGGLAYDGFVPDMIIVGIANGRTRLVERT